MEPLGSSTTVTASSVSRTTPTVLLSSGVGRLHFVETAIALQEAGTHVRMITGWLPTPQQRRLADLAGLVLGRSRLADRLALRTAQGKLSRSKLHSCSIAEAIAACGHHLFRSRGRTWSRVSRLTWVNFGRASRRFIHGADLFHVRSGAGQGGAISVARQRGMRVVVDHSIAHPAFLAERLDPHLKRLGMALLGGANDPFWSLVLKDCHDADLLLVNSDFVRDSFTEKGFPADRIRVAYLGVRDDFCGLKHHYRRHAPIRLLFTGSFGVRKGAATLLEVMTRLATQGGHWELDVLGDTSELPHLAPVHAVPTGVQFRGTVLQDELRDWLRRSDIYVFPSLAEGCAKSAMEAFAAGVPVITTRETGLPAEHMKSAWVVPSGDAAAIVEAIEVLSADQNLRESLGRKAAELVRNHFRWPHYARAVREVHAELLR